MKQTQAGRWLTFYDPLSSVMVQLIDGVARHRMLRRGVRQAELHTAGMVINYYHLPAYEPPAGAQRDSMPILLVHGIGDSAMTWVFVIRRLARTHDVYALDLPGHGFSTLPLDRPFISLDEDGAVLETFIREVIGRPALVVGNSLGGMLAVRLARAAQEWVRGIVMLDPGGAPLGGRETWNAFFERIADSRLSTTWRASRGLMRNVPGVALALGLRGLQKRFQRPVIIDAYYSSDDSVFLSAEELQQLPVPVGLIWGEDDRFLPDGSLEWFRANLPDAPKLVLKRCGHLPQRERPGSVVRFIRAFAADLAAATAAERAAGP